MTVHTLPLLHEDEQHIGVAADWHGRWRWSTACIDAFGRAGISSVFQLGDFGIWPGESGVQYLDTTSAALEKWGMKIYVTLGNHEDYDQVDAHEKDDQGIAWFRHNIAVLPRVYGFVHRNRNFLSLGGAPSIDFEFRTLGVDWWPQEMLTEADVDQAIEVSKELGRVNVMFTHDAPDHSTYAVQKIIDYNPQGWNDKSLAYASEGRRRMNTAVYDIEPELLLHGHYHVFDYGSLSYGDKAPGMVLSFNPDGMANNIGIIDVDDLYNIRVVKNTVSWEFSQMFRTYE